jgi:hypothetical protein
MRCNVHGQERRLTRSIELVKLHVLLATLLPASATETSPLDEASERICGRPVHF